MAVRDLSNAIAAVVVFFFPRCRVRFKLRIAEREKADGCLPIDRSSHTINPAGFHRYVIKADVVDIYVRAGVSVSYSAAGGHRAHRSVTTAAAAAAAAAVVADLPVTNDSPREIIKKKKRK